MSGPFGVIAVFETAEAAVEAARRLRALGFRALEAYTPYPVEELDAVMPLRRRSLLPLLIFAGAIIGACCGYFIQYWAEALDYPINVGGRPYNSWPAFVVSTFEVTVLFALAAGFFGLLASCRLPRLYHPIFAAEGFERASRDRFVLCIEASDPSYQSGLLRRTFERCGATRIAEVPG
ncbi:MAG: DUF3341 domain-containing protein [Alphaproteobacteria bacterium]|nr:DUF3341 domain-containing protein [Alphaproteobacteria bacterium]